jgi:hypothetical protein
MTISFLKTGSAVHEEVQKADAEQAARFGPGRFWVEKGKEARITFLDGHMEEGLIQTVSFYEHMIPRGAGKKGFDTFPCTQETEACPICEGGNQPALVFAFTILDHREWKDKNGKVHEHEKRLFVCKRESFKLLQATATKLMAPSKDIAGKEVPPRATNGLLGVTFDVMRIGEKSAGVGTSFEFVACTPLTSVYEGCGIKTEDQGVFNYGEVLKYFPAAELRKLGFGVVGAVGSADVKAAGTVGKEAEKHPGSPFGSKKFDPAKEM